MAELKISVLVPLSGPAGLFGPSSRDCALLAASEINHLGGILDAEIKLDFIDAGKPKAGIIKELSASIEHGCQVLIGAHDSFVRNTVCEHIQGSLPYIYSPPYEGDEIRKGIFVLGETPYQQLSPVIPWFMDKKGINTWYMIGNNYEWPYVTNWLAKQFIGLIGGEVLGEEYVPFESENFDHTLRQIETLQPDAVLITLVGSDSINFNRGFAGYGLSKSIIRFGPLIEENTLLGIGVENSTGIFSASGYFTSLQTEENQRFIKRYTDKFGDDAPMLNVIGQSCYDALHFFAKLAAKARSIEVKKLSSIGEGFTFDSPRGQISMNNHHSTKTIYLAEADGIDFEILTSFTRVPANAPGH